MVVPEVFQSTHCLVPLGYSLVDVVIVSQVIRDVSSEVFEVLGEVNVEVIVEVDSSGGAGVVVKFVHFLKLRELLVFLVTISLLLVSVGGKAAGGLKNAGSGKYTHSVFEALLPLPRCISKPKKSNTFLRISRPLVRSSLDSKMKAPSSTKRVWMILKISLARK